MSIPKSRLHELIERIPTSEYLAVLRYLEFLADRFSDETDDTPLTDDQVRKLQEIAREPGRPWAEVRKELRDLP